MQSKMKASFSETRETFMKPFLFSRVRVELCLVSVSTDNACGEG